MKPAKTTASQAGRLETIFAAAPRCCLPLDIAADAFSYKDMDGRTRKTAENVSYSIADDGAAVISYGYASNGRRGRIILRPGHACFPVVAALAGMMSPDEALAAAKKAAAVGALDARRAGARSAAEYIRKAYRSYLDAAAAIIRNAASPDLLPAIADLQTDIAARLAAGLPSALANHCRKMFDWLSDVAAALADDAARTDERPETISETPAAAAADERPETISETISETETEKEEDIKMKTYTEWKALDRETRFPLADALRDDVRTLETIYGQHVGMCSAKPAETVAAFIAAVGYPRALAAFATLVNRHAWDGRISRRNAAWAAAVPSSWDEETAEHIRVYTNRIHLAHLDQLADAFRAVPDPGPAPSDDDERPETISADAPAAPADETPAAPETPSARTDETPAAELSADERPETISADPAPAAPETPSASAAAGSWCYHIYVRLPGEKRFLLADLAEGTVGMNKIYAPRYSEKDLPAVKKMLDRVAAENRDAAFQLRKTDGRTVVYTADPARAALADETPAAAAAETPAAELAAPADETRSASAVAPETPAAPSAPAAETPAAELAAVERPETISAQAAERKAAADARKAAALADIREDWRLHVVAVMDAFPAVYSRLYDADCPDRDAAPIDYSADVASFDAFMKAPVWNEFISACAKYRGDFFASDREAAAIIIAIRETREARREAAERAAAEKAAASASAETQAETPDETPAAELAADERPETISADAPAARTDETRPASAPAAVKPYAGQAITGDGWTIIFDPGLNRTRVIISDALREKLAPIIESAGFYYSRNLGSYNKKLTNKAHRAALALAETLRAAVA